MQRSLTPTLAVILAGGLAAGIALARPASTEQLSPGRPYPATGDAPTDAGGDPAAIAGGDQTGNAQNGPEAPAGTTTDGPSRRGNRSAGSRGDGGATPGQSPEPAPPAPSDGAAITIEDFTFDGPAAVPVGTALRVTNLDEVAHTLTFRTGEVDTGTIDGGSNATLTAPPTPGTYAFFCRIHPAMQGQIDVTGR